MNTFDDEEEQPSFHSLPPHAVLSLVETALGRRCSNLCRSMNSYINRVFELASEDGEGLIVKFYRPGRWSREAIADEHALLLELAAEEIPVIAPLTLKDGSTLANHGDLHFALFPKKGGRSFDEYNLDQWLELGRLIGRVHLVGGRRDAGARITMTPDRSTRAQVEYILAGDFMAPDLAASFRKLTDTLIAEITPLFAGIEKIRIHGDCHFANLIHRPGESFFLIDFDDMAMGPPVQDFWMLLPGHLHESLAEVDLFLEGYETFRDFDRSTLRLIEPLRAMRYIHYTAWCARQVAEDGASQVSPDFGSPGYWEQEIGDLADQLEVIRSAPEGLGNSL